MLRKAQLDLDLFVRRHAALERPGSVEHPAHHGLGGRVNRQGEFAVDHEMAEIGAQAEVLDGVQQLQGRVEVVQQAVPMGFELQREVGLVGDVDPAASDRNHPLQVGRHHLADDTEEWRAEVLGHGQHEAQFVVAAGKAVEQAFQAVPFQQGPRPLGQRRVRHGQVQAYAGELRFGDPGDMVLERRLGLTRTAQLHRPERLVDL